MTLKELIHIKNTLKRIATLANDETLPGHPERAFTNLGAIAMLAAMELTNLEEPEIEQQMLSKLGLV